MSDILPEELAGRIVDIERRLRALEQAQRGYPRAAPADPAFAAQLYGTPESAKRLLARMEEDFRWSEEFLPEWLGEDWRAEYERLHEKPEEFRALNQRLKAAIKERRAADERS